MERSPSSCGERREWVGGWVDCIYTKSVAFIQFQTGIYTIPDWHLYNSRLAFIQFQTGIYTIPDWHLYNSTLAFIQVMSLLPIFSQNSSWHSAMNSMRNLNACHPWQSAAQFFFFLPKTPHGTLP